MHTTDNTYHSIIPVPEPIYRLNNSILAGLYGATTPKHQDVEAQLILRVPLCMSVGDPCEGVTLTTQAAMSLAQGEPTSLS